MKALIAVFVTAAFLLGGCGVVDKAKEINDRLKPPPEQRGSFDDLVSSFDSVYKDAREATGNGQADEAETKAPEAAGIWAQIEKNFAGSQPAEYAKTANWESAIRGIGDLMREADRLTAQGQLEAAHAKLVEARDWLKEIREENQVRSLTDLMIDLSAAVDDVADSPAKDAVKLQELRRRLEPVAAWEEYRADASYQAMVGELTEVIKLLQIYDGDEYRTELEKLRPAFLRLYLAYG
jgi:hypothetical protein